MSEHHTQGRQGQGARHNRRYRSRSNRNHRQRMPRREESSSAKPSLFKRILSFLGFGKKKPQQTGRKKNKGQEKQAPPQRVRVAQTNKTPRNAGKDNAKGNRRHPASVPPTDQARLYVGNLSFEATEAELEDLFKGFGHVRSVEIIYNTRTYRSKGYAFVEMEQLADARRAAEVLHGQPFMGRELMVSAASEKTERSADSAPQPTNREEAPKATPAPAAAEEEEDEVKEAEVTFGEEVVVSLTPDPIVEAPAEPAAPAAEAPAPEPTPEPAPEAAAEEAPAAAPAEEAQA